MRVIKMRAAYSGRTKQNSRGSPFSFPCSRKRTARVRCWSTCGHRCRWPQMASSRQTTLGRQCLSARYSRFGSAGSTWPTWAACKLPPWWRTEFWAAPCRWCLGSWTWCTTDRNHHRRPPRSYRSGVCHISAGQLRDTVHAVDQDRARQGANVDEHARHIAAGRYCLGHRRTDNVYRTAILRARSTSCHVRPDRPSTTTVGPTTSSLTPVGDNIASVVLRRWRRTTGPIQQRRRYYCRLVILVTGENDQRD